MWGLFSFAQLTSDIRKTQRKVTIHIPFQSVALVGVWGTGTVSRDITTHTLIFAQASWVDSVPRRSLISMEPRYCKRAGDMLVCGLSEDHVREDGDGSKTYTGFISARFKDELLGLMMPVLDQGVRSCQARWPQGQTGLLRLLFIPFLQKPEKIQF